MNSLELREVDPFDLNGFRDIIGDPSIRRLQLLADKLHKAYHDHQGKTSVLHINSSAVGGGVADILNCLVPLARELGVPTQWWVIGGDTTFFKVTKSFHNALQGAAQVDIHDEMLAHYEQVTAGHADRLGRLIREQHRGAPDIIVFHDPQPAGLVSHWRSQFPETVFLWRGHIHFDVAACAQPSHPAHRIWKKLVQWVNQCDGAIFHLPEQVPPGIRVPVRFILPSINPMAPINRDLSGPAAVPFLRSTLSKYGMEDLQDPSVPLVLQNARFDPWKDPLGVIEAFEQARRCLSRKRKPPRLLLTGPMASDDPEAHEILVQLGGLANGDGAVRVLPLFPKDNEPTAEQAKALREIQLDPERLRSEDLLELEINVFQTRADIVVAKSLREGFGLTVTGAGYHAKPRIVSQVGGLSSQLIDRQGRHYGFLVGGSPHFSREVSINMTKDWIVKLLGSVRLRRSMGLRGKRYVIRHFLPHRHLHDYFKLFLDLKLGKALVKDTLSPVKLFSKEKVEIYQGSGT